ncbi:MAG: hypothetical protein WA921_10595 [Ahrensia sp.]
MQRNKPQIDKFREAARELEADESTESFERKLKKLVKPDKADTKKPDEKKPAD